MFQINDVDIITRMIGINNVNLNLNRKNKIPTKIAIRKCMIRFKNIDRILNMPVVDSQIKWQNHGNVPTIINKPMINKYRLFCVIVYYL